MHSTQSNLLDRTNKFNFSQHKR
uniref:Uncharacterized protein n=1 Tax=Anguilla anguilla TaxID=7936 RepID=A0A0E9VRW1_ANGAN